MEFKPNQGVSDSLLSAFENELRFKLPDDYRTFVLRFNGGAFSGGYAEIPASGIGVVSIDCFYGLELKSPLNLSFWLREMRQEIPQHSLIIGKSPGGGFLLLCCAPELSGVFYYDHSYDHPSSNDEQNTYPIAATFADLARLLRF